MPVLQHRKGVMLPRNSEGRRDPYDRGHQVHGTVGQAINDVERKGVALMNVGSKKKGQRSVPSGSPCFQL